MKKTILTSLLIAFTTLVSSAQVRVTGVVLDENNQPMPGAAVLLEGDTSHGVITDENGRYHIVVPSTESVLRYEFMGYSSVKMMVGKKTTLNILLYKGVGE